MCKRVYDGVFGVYCVISQAMCAEKKMHMVTVASGISATGVLSE